MYTYRFSKSSNLWWLLTLLCLVHARDIQNKNAIQILICDKNQTEHRPIITCWLWIPLAIVLLTRKKNGMWGKNRSQSIKSFAFGFRKTDNFQFAMTVYCINNIIRPVVINFVFCLFILKSIFAQLYVNTQIYTYKCM